MSKSIFQSRPLTTNTWLIKGRGCNSYLVVGEDHGIVIDTGFATENIQRYAQTLTSKPVRMAANTHGHFDHTGGNGWFSGAYMTAKALEIAKEPYASLDAAKYPTDYTITIIGEGDKIDLGDRVLEVIEIPAHAPSSIAFLDRKERILFSGDEVESVVMLVWLQDHPQPTVVQHANNMERLLTYQNAYDFICGGHRQVMGDAVLVGLLLENDRQILSGNEGVSWVREPDTPADFHMPQPEFKRVSNYKGTSIGYDIRYVHHDFHLLGSK